MEGRKEVDYCTHIIDSAPCVTCDALSDLERPNKPKWGCDKRKIFGHGIIFWPFLHKFENFRRILKFRYTLTFQQDHLWHCDLCQSSDGTVRTNLYSSTPTSFFLSFCTDSYPSAYLQIIRRKFPLQFCIKPGAYTAGSGCAGLTWSWQVSLTVLNGYSGK